MVVSTRRMVKATMSSTSVSPAWVARRRVKAVWPESGERRRSGEGSRSGARSRSGEDVTRVVKLMRQSYPAIGHYGLGFGGFEISTGEMCRFAPGTCGGGAAG